MAIVPTAGAPLLASQRRTIAIVIPAYNEEAGIGEVLARLAAEKPDSVTEIIVVDDASQDRTSQICEEAGVHVIRHQRNRGYGGSLKTGIRAATADYILTMDADGQHRMEDVQHLCHQVQVEDPPDCVIGQRTALVHSPLWRMPGKWFLTTMAEFLIEQRIPDLNSGLRLVKRDVVMRYMRLCPQGFSFSTTLTMSLLSRGHGVVFEPIQVKPRQGKSTVKIRTGFQTIMLVLRLATLFNPLRIFLPISLFCWLLGIVWGLPYILMREGVTVGAMLAILTGVLMFALGLITDQLAALRLERFE